MSAIEKWGPKVLEIANYVRQLDDAVLRHEAFRFLLEREAFGVSSQVVQAPIPPLNPAEAQEAFDRDVAPQELLRKTRVTSFADKAVVLGYWLERYQDKSTFSSGDIKFAFDRAREQRPKNASDLVSQLEGTARLMRAEKNGATQMYRLTRTAIEDIEQRLNTIE